MRLWGVSHTKVCMAETWCRHGFVLTSLMLGVH